MSNAATRASRFYRAVFCACLGAAAFVGAPFVAVGHPHDTVLWPVGPGAPLFTEAGDGYGDRMRRWFIERLTTFDHTEAPSVPLDRALDLMRRQDGVCHPLLFRTEARLAFATFSKPIMMTPSIHLIAPAADASFWRARRMGDVVSPAAIVASERRAAVMTGRTYGAEVDRLIDRLDALGRVQFLDAQTAVFAHLDRGWAGFTFGYANERAESVETFVIDGVETGKLARVACSDGPLGRAVIDAVDALIAEAGPAPVWLRFYTDTLDDDGRAAFEDALKRRAPWGPPPEG